jgi:hypothetical protein
MTVPDDAYWYHLAYGVAALIYVAYTASIWWRRRCLRARE